VVPTRSWDPRPPRGRGRTGRRYVGLRHRPGVRRARRVPGRGRALMLTSGHMLPPQCPRRSYAEKVVLVTRSRVRDRSPTALRIRRGGRLGSPASTWRSTALRRRGPEIGRQGQGLRLQCRRRGLGGVGVAAVVGDSEARRPPAIAGIGSSPHHRRLEGRMGPHHRGEPHRHVPRVPGDDPAPAQDRREHRQHRVDRRCDRPALQRRLLRVEGGVRLLTQALGVEYIDPASA